MDAHESRPPGPEDDRHLLYVTHLETAVGELCAIRARNQAAANYAMAAETVERRTAQRDEARQKLGAMGNDLAHARAEVERLRTEVKWRDEWSNELAVRMPEPYDGDEPQEAIISRWIDDLLDEVERLRKLLAEAPSPDLVQALQIRVMRDDRELARVSEQAIQWNGEIRHLRAEVERLRSENAKLRTPPWRLFGCTPDDLRSMPLAHARTLRAMLQDMADSGRTMLAGQAEACAEAAAILDKRLGEPEYDVLAKDNERLRADLADAQRVLAIRGANVLGVQEQRDTARAEVERLTAERDGWKPLTESLTRSLDVERATVERLRGLLGEALVDAYRAGLSAVSNRLAYANAEQYAREWLVRSEARAGREAGIA